MVVKKIPINKLYQIDIYCEDCNVPMEGNNVVLSTYPPTYSYTCPNCGKTETSTVDFPKQGFELDNENAEILDDFTYIRF